MPQMYDVGDLVDFCGNKAIVKSVKEGHYFYDGNSPYYEYVVELTETGALHTVMQSALTLISKHKSSNMCECGAWALHWANNDHHADYCPLANYFLRS